jgi:putative polymerase
LQLSKAFADGYAGDSGYGYVLVKVGLVGLAAIWALFVYTPTFDKSAWRFKIFIALYMPCLCLQSAHHYSR